MIFDKEEGADLETSETLAQFKKEVGQHFECFHQKLRVPMDKMRLGQGTLKLG